MSTASEAKRRSQRLGAVLLLGAATLLGAVASHTGTDASEGRAGSLSRRGPVAIAAQLDREAVLAGSDGELRVELLLRGQAPDLGSTPERVPTDFIVVLDRSGSMEGSALAHAKSAVRELLEALRPEDRFSLVTYASESELLLPLQHARAGLPRLWGQELAQVVARGGTNMSRGLDLALAQVSAASRRERVVRVLLLSDGHANEGDASYEGLLRRARVASEQRAVLSAAGVGDGFDERLMGGLADAGTGNFYYVRHGEDLASVMNGEFASARATVASGLEVHLDPRPGVEIRSASGYPLERWGDAVVFRPGALFAGQERRIWLTLRAPTAELGAVPLARVRVRFHEGMEAREIALPNELEVACVGDPDAFYASIDEGRLDQGLLEEGIGALKQEVARAVSAGDRALAEREIQGFVERNRPAYELLDHVDAEPMLAADALQERVKQAFAAPASAAAPSTGARQNSLGKALTAEGRDQRRAGAKSAIDSGPPGLAGSESEAGEPRR